MPIQEHIKEKIEQNTISEGTNPQTSDLTAPAREISAAEPAPDVPPVKEHYASDEYDSEIFGGVRFDTTADIPIPKTLIDQVIGQEHAVDVIKKAAIQRRHVMMIGSPGTGKSMLAKAMSELLPKEEMQDILTYPNPEDNNNPIIRVVNAGRGKEIVARHKEDAKRQASSKKTLMIVIIIGIIGIFAISGQLLLGLFAALFIFFIFRTMMPMMITIISVFLDDA